MKRIFSKLSDDHLHKLNTTIIYDNKTVLHLYNSYLQNKSPDNKQPQPTLKRKKNKSFSLYSRQRCAIVFTNWTYLMLVCIVWVCFLYYYYYFTLVPYCIMLFLASLCSQFLFLRFVAHPAIIIWTMNRNIYDAHWRTRRLYLKD